MAEPEPESSSNAATVRDLTHISPVIMPALEHLPLVLEESYSLLCPDSVPETRSKRYPSSLVILTTIP